MLRRPGSYLFTLLLFLAIRPSALCAQSPGPEARLSVEEVVNLTRAGFAEDIIITKIKKNGKAFDLSTEELVDLKKDGVSDNVIKYLLDPSQPYSPPSPVAASNPANPSTPAKKYPPDAYASRVPAEPGLYFFPAAEAVKAEPVKSDLKFLLGEEQGKSLMKKGKSTAYLMGSTSKMRIKRPKPTLYVRLPDGKEIEELVLLVLSPKNGRRELDAGPPGPKQQLKADQLRQFEPLEVGPHLFKLTPVKLDPGEYLFFFVGSADPAKGIYGKAYDFGLDEVPPPKK